jgi:hypothetical protein
MDAGTDWVASQGRYALDLDGSDDIVQCTANAANNITTSLSVSAWVYVRTTAFQAVISKWGGFASQWKLMTSLLTNGIPYFDVSSTGNNDIYRNMDSVLPLNSWQHLCGVYNSVRQTLDIYHNGRLANGSLVGTVPTSLVTSTQPIRFGADNQASNILFRFLNGLVDDSMFFNRAMQPNEIRLLASRRGIAYEMAPRSWTSQQIAAYRARYYAQVIGSGVV